jgi:hypothetical protein
MSLFPHICQEMNPRWLIERWADSSAVRAIDASTEKTIEDRNEASIRLGGKRGRTSRVTCSECGLAYLASRGHRDSPYCWRVRTIVWAYANDLFPLSLQARDSLVDAGCRYEWLLTGPVLESGTGASKYKSTGALSHKLWGDSSAAALIYLSPCTPAGYAPSSGTWSAITARLKAGERGDPLGIPRLWSHAIAETFGAKRHLPRPEVPERYLYTEVEKTNYPRRRPGR